MENISSLSAGIAEAEGLSPLTQKLTILHLPGSDAFQMVRNPEHVKIPT
jgi:hypothetical protein